LLCDLSERGLHLPSFETAISAIALQSPLRIGACALKNAVLRAVATSALVEAAIPPRRSTA
jgi:hypothetical protein